MKRLPALLTCILALAMLLTACNGQTGMGTGTGTEAGTTASTAPQKLSADELEAEAYTLSFTSNGDGTCTLSGIKLNREITQPSAITVPEKSPEGETVTGVAHLGSFGHANVPQVMLPEDYEAISAALQQAVEKELISQWTANKNLFFYTLCELEAEQDPAKREQMLAAHPVVEFTPVYVLGDDITPSELNLLAEILYTYADFTPGDCKAVYDKINAINSTVWYEIPVDVLGALSAEGIVSVTLPATLTKIEARAFSGFAGLKQLCFDGTRTEWEALGLQLDDRIAVFCADDGKATDTASREEPASQKDTAS